MRMNINQATLALDDFFLGAAMQDSPSPDDFGGMDGEPQSKGIFKPEVAKQFKPVKPNKKLTYQDYIKIHCGNKAAALYWYERNEGRPLR